MTKRDEDLQKAIREAAEEGRIELAETDVIAEYDEIAEDFFNMIFAMDYTDCFISDESSLSDFAGCCIPANVEVAPRGKVTDLYDIGRKNMLVKIKKHYGIDVDPYDTLIIAFEKIKQTQNRKLN